MREQGLGGLKAPRGTKCKNCGELTLPHRVCMKCGYYNGKQIVEVKVKSKSEKRKNE